MRLMTSLLLLVVSLSAPARVADPLSGLRRFEPQVVFWEGSFGSYLHPDPGTKLVLDLEQVGTRDLLGTSTDDPGASGYFDLRHLAIVSDVVEGNGETGWSRRVLLRGRRRQEGSAEQTVLELVLQHELEGHDERGRRERSNMSHQGLTLHTLRDDGSVREFARARMSFERSVRPAVLVSDDVRRAIHGSLPPHAADDFESLPRAEIEAAITGDGAILAVLWAWAGDDADARRCAAATSALLDVGAAQLATGYSAGAAHTGLKFYLSGIPHRLRLRALELVVSAAPRADAEARLVAIEQGRLDPWFLPALPQLRAALRPDTK